MKFSRLFSKTQRTESSDTEMISHRLMFKAGLVSQVTSGVFTYLPLAWRSLRKIEQIIREEMDIAGGQELRMPVLQPMELWDQTGRSNAFGEALFSLQDRRRRSLVIAPTHEEVVTNLVKSSVQSYRDLPVVLYQIQTKFRDELRPRGGLIRVREFDMKDAYSFDADDNGLDVNYQIMAQAYRNIYKRCGLDAIMVEADSGAIGGKDSHEFILLTPSGEDTIIICPNCGYTANAEKAKSVKAQPELEDLLQLEEVSTPNAKSISELCDYLGIAAERTLKTIFYFVNGEVVLATLRGDLEVNEVKLGNVLGAHGLRLATDQEVAAAGLTSGYASMIGLQDIRKVADDSVRLGANFVVGGNKHDSHFRNANYLRDFQTDIIADIALARAGEGCPHCSAHLEEARGIEVGHIFKLGRFFSDTLGAYFLDRDGLQRSVVMGCYGIGLGRLLAASIEQHHDGQGIVFPIPIAPFQVHLVGLNVGEPSVAQVADNLYSQLWARGIETLYDDRIDESAGVKLKDSDLLGLPIRLVVSPRSLKAGSIEIKVRKGGETLLEPEHEAVQFISDLLARLE